MEASTPAHTDPALTSITAQTGGNICAPLLHGNHFQGSVTVVNITGGQEASSFSTNSVQADSSLSAPTLPEDLLDLYKQKLENKFKSINEGISQHGKSANLNEIYTELYITEGGSGEVNDEHEVRFQSYQCQFLYNFFHGTSPMPVLLSFLLASDQLPVNI
ncbi:hypothetical protein AOLI_G00152810 [Acnodon oligacanthus]